MCTCVSYPQVTCHVRLHVCVYAVTSADAHNSKAWLAIGEGGKVGITSCTAMCCSLLLCEQRDLKSEREGKTWTATLTRHLSRGP